MSTRILSNAVGAFVLPVGTRAESRFARLDNDRLEMLEREMASLKGQVNQTGQASDENELNRTYTLKKPPLSARTTSPSRIPLPITPRRGQSDNASVASGRTVPLMRPPATASAAATSVPPPVVPMVRSQTFHQPATSYAPSMSHEEANLLRAYKVHLEKVFRKDPNGTAEMKIPNYSSVEDVIRANEVLAKSV